MALADDVGGHFFRSSLVIGLTPSPAKRTRDPTTEIVPRPDAWTACPIRWNDRAVFTHSIIALLAKTMILLTMT
jgi:hypothetical protein